MESTSETTSAGDTLTRPASSMGFWSVPDRPQPMKRVCQRYRWVPRLDRLHVFRFCQGRCPPPDRGVIPPPTNSRRVPGPVDGDDAAVTRLGQLIANDWSWAVD